MRKNWILILLGITKMETKKKITPSKKIIPKKITPPKKITLPKKTIPPKKIIPPKKKLNIIIETPEEVSTDEKYSEKLKVLINKIKSQTLGESENKIRFGWKY